MKTETSQEVCKVLEKTDGSFSNTWKTISNENSESWDKFSWKIPNVWEITHEKLIKYVKDFLYGLTHNFTPKLNCEYPESIVFRTEYARTSVLGLKKKKKRQELQICFT